MRAQNALPVAPDRTRQLFAVAAAAALVLGFVDLMRGGITVAPFLLVVGYGVLVPLALWRPFDPRLVPARTGDDPGHAPPYLGAALSAAAILTVYILTLAPSTAMWDTSEYMAAAYTLGLPHPPGNPFFVLLGRVVALLPIAPSVAARINLLAALSSAVAAGIWFLVTEHVLATWVVQRWLRLTGATAAALLGGTAYTVWSQSVVNEKVYTVALAGIAIVSWLMIRWCEEPDGSRADRRLIVIAYLLALGFSNHMAGMLPGPAVALAVLVRRPRTVRRGRLLAACASVIVLGMTPFATQPIRAAFNPPINEGEPTACRNGLHLDCTFSQGTFDAFAYNFNREQYGKPALSDRQAPFAAQLQMWWLYFRWQWMRDAHDEHSRTQGLLAVVFFAAGLAGGWIHFRRHRSSFWYFGTLMFLMTLALIYYLNFRYGASQEGAADVAREVRDRDYFFLWSFSAWGVWVGIAAVQLVLRLAALGTRRMPDSPAAPSRPLMLAASGALLAVAAIPLVSNWHAASRRGDVTTLEIARDLLNSVEPYGILVTAGDNDTFPIWYAQEVEGIRQDVTVAVLSLLNTDWFARGLVRRPVHLYDAARGPAIYRSHAWPVPTTPPLHLTLAEIDSLPPYVDVAEPVVFRHGGIEATIEPRNLASDGQGGGVLERADLLVLRMITDAGPARPVYISRTTANYPNKLGLAGYVLTQGLARKVFVPPAAATRDTVRVDGDGWLDVSRSRALWQDSFHGPEAIIRKGDWIDQPSLSAPLTYLFAGGPLAEVLERSGDHSAAESIRSELTGILHATRMERILGAGAAGRRTSGG